MTPERKKIVWANLQRIVDNHKRSEVGQVKKVWGDTLEGVTPESNKKRCDSDEQKK